MSEPQLCPCCGTSMHIITEYRAAYVETHYACMTCKYQLQRDYGEQK